jgi:hypothetical protein
MSQMPPPEGPGWGPPEQGPPPSRGPAPGAPPPAPGYPPAPGPGSGPPPGGPYAPQPGYGPPPGAPGGPPGRKSNPVIPIVIVLVLVAAAVGGFFLFSGDDDESADPPASDESGQPEVTLPEVPEGDGGDVEVPEVTVPDVSLPETGGVGAEELGEPTDPPVDGDEAAANPALVDAANQCHDGDLAACDQLWWDTDLGGELEAYAATCGGRLSEGVSGNCETFYG